MTREEWAALSWTGEGDPPELPPVIRTVTPDEQMQAMISCLTDAGFPPLVDPDSKGYGNDIPAAQIGAYAEANYLCHASYPLEEKYYQPFNDNQLRAWFDHLVGPATSCLADQGYAVTEQAPSPEAWIQAYRSGREGRWSPFNAVPDHERDSVIDTCPIQPDNFFDLATTH